MKKYLGTIFLIFGFLEIIVLSEFSNFDSLLCILYEVTVYVIGFMINYCLWLLLVGSVIVLFCGVVLIVLEYSKR